MLGVVITGHGGFASGLLQAVQQVIGPQEQCVAIDFPEGMCTDTLQQALKKASQQCDRGEGVVFLTDLLGGSPFRQASLMALENENYQVITGTNMQMAAEMMLERDGMSVSEFRDMALECGHRGLTSLWHEQQREKDAVVNDDGI
ncbi:PTS galactosamine/N-acetylgalactosamine transporter subunit IIA [Providencia vermicola]|uniref:PTS galactosamine/N-acetylgalactosamine transporter subunit IIA n=1 Tax=Providencia TaxID=586 RepID=UPI0012B5D95E|nr:MULTISPECIES: PTS galactosamine/N-acetylgalactosamine transporter subunit IIA [Providencia]ELR5143658.1 PTS sugar transporter subunit IIA [Providencia stuartii]MTB40260.1 PTS N-acetylgalactosamine transporter subunit IIA [Providencia sp. wls1949]MTC06834.1 PTS N-acetylgalactosamine transporter subunit IIA [Providencia sp. wls1948]WBA56810.1 PTS galactosamine/N-acetylgalactosamine transporter subunit IIA [Providencia sp. 21OH12SH02B-Prov]WER22566.1 PTS galactosamine/N-acetylgalactosamine tra